MRVAVAQDVGAFEAVFEHQFLVVKNIARRAFGNDASLIQNDDTLANFNDHFEIVRGDDAGLLQTAQQFDQAAAPAGIKIGGRFIQNQNIGRDSQYRCDGNGAFFAAGKFVRRAVRQMLHADPLQRTANPVFDFVRGQLEGHPVETLEPVVTSDEVAEVQRTVSRCHVSEEVYDYVLDLIEATRDSDQLYLGAGPRGSLALVRCAQAKATLDGRDYVGPDDIKSIATEALAHRLIPRPEARVSGVTGTEVVEELLERIAVPS